MLPPPLIGITAGNDPNNESYYLLRWDYVRSVEAAGGLPVILAPGGAAEHPGLLDRLHGLVLSGGIDLAPSRYGEEPHETVVRVSPERDAFEIGLIEDALTRRLPLFGICRGMQVLNVALGGSLIQDIPSEVGRGIVHNDLEIPRHVVVHEVRIDPASRLHRMLPLDRVEVNSFHHQAPRRIGKGLRPVAWSEDGVIEGLELEGSEQLVFGVQWHPEAFWAHGAPFAPLFEAFVADARRCELRDIGRLDKLDDTVPLLRA